MPSQEMFFEEFFASGMEESISPFLTPNARKWGKHLPLKGSFLSAFFLLAGYIFSFFSSFLDLSHFFILLTFFFAGIPALIASIEELCHFKINIEVLMTLSAFGSIAIGNEKEGALLLVLFAISHAMEESVSSKAKGAISAFKKLAPTKAHVLCQDGRIIQKSINDIEIGSKILVKIGEIIPLDGKILFGAASISLVHLTGESIPQTKKAGDEVPSGGIPLDSSLTLEVVCTSNNSTLMKIIHLVIASSHAKPKLQRWIDKISRHYALAIMSIAFFIALAFPFFLAMPYLGKEGSIYRSLAFLIGSSPCALVIAIPIAYLSAISAIAKKGILLKGGLNLDALARCSILTFDKTGTLTTGELSCIGIEALDENKMDTNEALMLAAALEKNISHPIAAAILAQAKECPLVEIKNFIAHPGYGVEAIYREESVFLGKPEWVISHSLKNIGENAIATIKTLQQKGEILALLLKGDALILFRFKDTIRPKVKNSLQIFREKFHFDLVMLTGDHDVSAEIVGKELGIDKIHANCRPEDKLRIINELAGKRGLAMIGDGMNDAPAIAGATVGIAMGKAGSGVASSAADIILLHDNFEHLPWLFEKAKKTQLIVKENLIIALGAIIFAAIAALGGFIPLWLAVLLHEGGTVVVGLNSLRLLKR